MHFAVFQSFLTFCCCCCCCCCCCWCCCCYCHRHCRRLRFETCCSFGSIASVAVASFLFSSLLQVFRKCVCCHPLICCLQRRQVVWQKEGALQICELLLFCSLSLCVSVCLSACLSVWLPACLCLPLPASACLCLPLPASACLCLCLSLSLSLTLSLSISISLCLSVPCFLCVLHPLCRCLCICIYIHKAIFVQIYISRQTDSGNTFLAFHKAFVDRAQVYEWTALPFFLGICAEFWDATVVATCSWLAPKLVKAFSTWPPLWKVGAMVMLKKGCSTKHISQHYSRRPPAKTL